MPVVISLDVATGQRTAMAPGFRAVLPRSRLNPEWYTIDVTEAGPKCATCCATASARSTI